MSGGAAGDRFVFARLSRDRIIDLEDDVDKIHLDLIDADETGAGDQRFTVVAAFDGHAGRLVLAYDAVRDVTFVRLDTDGDNVADQTLLLTGDHHAFDRFVL